MAKIPLVSTYKFYLLTIVYAQNYSFSADCKRGYAYLSDIADAFNYCALTYKRVSKWMGACL